jgi:hypothetical protein
METKASAEFDQALEATHTSDAYTRAAVFLAMSLFFGGVGQAFDNRPVRIAMGVVALVALGIGLALVFTLPRLAPF